MDLPSTKMFAPDGSDVTTSLPPLNPGDWKGVVGGKSKLQHKDILRTSHIGILRCKSLKGEIAE